MPEIRVSIEAKELLAWSSKVVSKLPSAIASAINKTAREGRTIATQAISADENVSTAVAKRGIGDLLRASPGKLVASWTAKPTAIGLLNTFGAVGTKVAYTTAKAKRVVKQGKAMVFATFRVTGGGSSHLSLARGFVLQTKNGGRAIMVRTGTGRAAIKALYAEHAATAMSQADGSARVIWTKTVSKSLPINVTAAVQTVFNGGTVSAGSTSND